MRRQLVTCALLFVATLEPIARFASAAAASASTASSASSVASALTVITRYVAPDLAAEPDAVELAGIAGPDGKLLTLTWRKEASPFGFITWNLYLASEVGLLGQTADARLRVQVQGGEERVALQRVALQLGHTYVTALSYDAGSGNLELSVVDVTDGVTVVARQTTVGRYAGPLVADVTRGAGAELSGAEPVFLPVGLTWEILAGSTEGALLPSLRLSRHQLAAVRIISAFADPKRVLRLIGRRGEQGVVWAEAPLAAGSVVLPLSLAQIPSGRWAVCLELADDDRVWTLGTERTIEVVDGQVWATVPVLERRNGEVRGVIRVIGDGPLPGVRLQVVADVRRRQGSTWALYTERELLYEAVVDVTVEPADVPFTLGNRIDRDWAHIVTVSVEAAAGQPIAIASRPMEHFLPVGDSDLMGGIPQIDISDQRWRHSIVDHVPGWYLGHPDTVLMGDGRTIYVVYPLEHGGPTALRRSDDGGKTWSERLPVPENWSRTANVPTIFRLTDPAGVERLIVFQNMAKPGAEPRPANAELTLYRAYSEDGGKTWTPFEPTALRGQVAPNTVVPISGGRYLTVFQLNGTVQMALSSDGGLTWYGQRTIATHPDAALVEPAAVLSPDGREIAVLIRENSRKYNSMLIVSQDEGATWSEPVELPDTLTGDRHMPVYAPDGRLVITLRDVKEGSPTYGDFVAWIGTYDDLVNLRPGQYRVRLLENKRNLYDTGYAGLELLPDGTFVATTYVPLTYGAKPSVVSLRFTLEELDALAAAAFCAPGRPDEDGGASH